MASKKKSIPKVLKDLVWITWVGDRVAVTKCLCCETNEIRMNNFHCGHILSEAEGGTLSVDNLKPICAPCNLSMGSEHMDTFKERCGFKEMPLFHKRFENIDYYPCPGQRLTRSWWYLGSISTCLKHQVRDFIHCSVCGNHFNKKKYNECRCFNVYRVVPRGLGSQQII